MAPEKWVETDSDASDGLGAFGVGADRFGSESCGTGTSRKPAGEDACATLRDDIFWSGLLGFAQVWSGLVKARKQAAGLESGSVARAHPCRSRTGVPHG